mmetsp:Transcript_21850/g.16209  ORF Transcript_21850/g.16209 Transcript_21850/m.16209 type:complete len:127 (+) Transcript_21850:671-1051(+)
MLELGGGMVTYYTVLNDFGIPFLTAFRLNQQVGYYPLATDVYNPYEPNYGNSNFGINNADGEKDKIAWGTIYDNRMDMRIFYTFNKVKDWSQCRWDPQNTDIYERWRISPLTDVQICYTPEALFYA